MEAARRALGRRRGRMLADTAAVAWLAGLTAAFLAPALSHGSALGPYDLMHAVSLTHTLHPQVHNAVDSDEIQEFIPWQVLAWRQVHVGQLPLWDPFNLLGMPYGFNFQSAPFSLTVAIGYAFPLALAHTATVASRLLIAGTGAYVCGRVLRLPPLAAVTGATVFELCGAFTVWDGTFRAGAYCFTGWVLAASVVLLRGRRRAVPGVCLALALSMVLAAGDPQVDLLLLAFLAVFVAVVCAVRVRRAHSGGHGPARRAASRAVMDHVLALVAACALAAPVYLPSAQLLARSARSAGPYVTALPPVELTHLVFAGYDGVATTTASLIASPYVYNASVYVGAIALVLAVCGLAWWRRRPEVVALSVATGLALVVLFAPPVVTVMRHVPELKFFSIDFATTLCDFGLAMLAAFGFAALTAREQGAGAQADVQSGAVAALASAERGPAHAPRRRSDRDRALRLLWAGVAILAALVAALGLRLWAGQGDLTSAQAHVRTASFLWPSLSVVTCIVVDAVLAWSRRREKLAGDNVRLQWARCGAGVVLLVVEAAFLVVSGAWTGSSSAAPLAVPRAVATIDRAARGGLVGIGSCVENAFPGLGVMPNDNILYRMHELTDYDPILPSTYYASYGRLAHTSGRLLIPHVYCPAVTSLRIARFYGVSDVVEPTGSQGLAGTRIVASAGGDSLYAVAGSGRSTEVPLDRADGTEVAVAGEPEQRVVPSSFTSSGTVEIHLDARRASLLVVRVTDVPGWHATLDGRPLALEPYAGILMAAKVPSGRHVVVVSYWPPLLRDGLVASTAGAVAILCVLVAAGASRRRTRGPSAGGAAGSDC